MPTKRGAPKSSPEASPKKNPKKANLTPESILPEDWFKSNTSQMFVGAHVNGGVDSSVRESASLGGKAFALFLCNQRTWTVKPLEEVRAAKFRTACQELGYPSHLILPHCSYLMNIGAPDPDILSKSRSLLLDGLQRCEMMNAGLYCIHPGSSCGKISTDKCIENIAESINSSLANTNKVVAVIENMSKMGNTIGGDFNELREIIDRVKDKSRIGVCLDTCHAFAAGYDLRSDATYENTMQEFDQIIGLKYLKSVHLNDSKGGLNSHLDRHENIGKGKLGIEVFRRFMNDERFKNMPLILETPCEDYNKDNSIYKKEIALLYDMVSP